MENIVNSIKETTGKKVSLVNIINKQQANKLFTLLKLIKNNDTIYIIKKTILTDEFYNFKNQEYIGLYNDTIICFSKFLKRPFEELVKGGMSECPICLKDINGKICGCNTCNTLICIACIKKMVLTNRTPLNIYPTVRCPVCRETMDIWQKVN